MTALVRAPLCGEILGAGDTVTVYAALHPLSPARVTLRAPAGLSVAEIVDLAIERDPRGRVRTGLVAWVGADPIPRDRWRSVRPKAGTVLVLRAVPRGGGGGLFKSLAMLAVAILTAFVAPYLTPFLGPVLATVVAGAVAVGASLLLNALFPVNAKAKDAGAVYSIGGNQNLATPYQPLPVLHGRMRVYPRYGGSAYSEFEGENQVLRLLYVWGYGPMDVTDIKIGETPLDTYHDVQVETFYGYPADPQPTLYPTTVIQQDLNLEIKQVDGWTTRTTSADVTEWAIDFAAPNGLSATKTSGEVIVLSVNIEIEQSVAYAEAWTPVETLVMSGKSTRPIRLTVRRPVPAGTYDLRWRRTTPDTDSNPKLISNTAATAMRSYRATVPITFGKPIAVTALKIRATSQLSGIVDNLNAVCTSRVKAFDGATWIDDVPSTKPADQLVRVLQGPANPRPIPSSRIDWTTIQEWRTWCLTKGYAYNKLHAERQSVLDAAQDVASAGRAAIVFRDGKWSVVWDAADAPVVQHFTPRNSWDFRGKRSYRRLPHGYRVKFKNEARAWRDDEIVVYADGYDVTTATLFEELEFPGQTDHVLNWRHGRYHDAQVRLRPEEYRLNVDIEHLICTRGDRVRVTHDLPAWGVASGRVLALDGNVAFIDEAVTMVAGKSYCARFRLADGTGVVWRVTTAPGEVNALALDPTGMSQTARPAAGDLMMFGEVGQETVILRVKGITPGDDMSAELLLVDDAPEIANADLGDAPDVVDVPTPVDPLTRQPINLRIVEGTNGAAGGYAPTATLLWEVPAGSQPINRFEVALKAASEAGFGAPVVIDASSRSAVWTNLAPGSTTFRVRSVFADGKISGWSAITFAILSYSVAPPDVTGLHVAVQGGIAMFSWDAPGRVVSRLELRYSPATSGATWESAATVVSRPDGASVAVSYASGTYLAKFVNVGGVYSAAATALVVTASTLPSASPVGEVFDFHPFGGTHVGTVDVNGGVRLGADGGGGIVAEGSYQPAEIIALPAIYTCRLSGDILAHGVDLNDGNTAAPDIYGVDPAGWKAVLEIRSTRDDPAGPSAAWTEWATFVAGEFTGRAFAVRVRLSSLATLITPAVELIHLRADLEQRVEFGVGVAVPAAGRSVAFSPAFISAPAIVVTGRDFQRGDLLSWGARDASGFTLSVLDSTGAGASRTVDFIATGYGRKVS